MPVDFLYSFPLPRVMRRSTGHDCGHRCPHLTRGFVEANGSVEEFSTCAACPPKEQPVRLPCSLIPRKSAASSAGTRPFSRRRDAASVRNSFCAGVWTHRFSLIPAHRRPLPLTKCPSKINALASASHQLTVRSFVNIRGRSRTASYVRFCVMPFGRSVLGRTTCRRS